VTVISLLGLILACPTESKPAPTPPATVNQTPEASQYDVAGTGTFVYDTANPVSRPVTVKPKEGFSPATPVVQYVDKNNAVSTIAPVAIGVYAVTFDVPAAPGWNAVKGLSAGFVNITNGELPTPELSNFEIKGLPQNLVQGATPEPVSIKGKGDYESAVVRIFYTLKGSQPSATPNDFPTAPGIYDVTFNVDAKPENWNAAVGLRAGSVFISAPGSGVEVIDLKFTDFDIIIGEKDVQFPSDNNSSNVVKIPYNEAIQRITVKERSGNTYPGNKEKLISITYYDLPGGAARIDAAMTKGSYKAVVEMKGHVGDSLAWAPATFTLFYNIEPRKPAASDYDITSLIQAEAGKALQDDRDVTHVRIVRKPTYKVDVSGNNRVLTDDGKDILNKPGISSKGAITVRYEQLTGAAGEWPDKTKEITEVYLGTNGKTTISGATITTSLLPPQKWGTYKVTFKVAKPALGYVAPQFVAAEPWKAVTDTDIANWEESDGYLDGGILELLPLLPLNPKFVNIWIDADDDIVNIKTPNAQEFMRPGEEITFNFTGAGTVTQWFADGSKVADSVNSYKFKSSALGRHEITVFVKYKPPYSEEKVYSRRFPVLVVQAQ